MKTGVLGASGYAGGELLRILASHPHLEVSYIAAGTSAGEEVCAVHSHLVEYEGRKFESLDLEKINDLELVFIALPHGESAKLAPKLGKHLKVIDLGADFRLRDAGAWQRYYGIPHAGTWLYGLPEIQGHRELIRAADRIANPGCYATAASLGIAPALEDGAVDTADIVMVAASGTTGAGRSNKTELSASEIMNSLSSYKFGGVHQHTPEIEEALSGSSGRRVRLSFTPILAPMPRGILATLTMRFTGDFESLRKRYELRYEKEPFVKLLGTGKLPETSSLIGSNSAHIQIAHDEHAERVVISVAIDNLGKGAAGQAVQNANLISGFTETAGLSRMGIGQ